LCHELDLFIAGLPATEFVLDSGAKGTLFQYLRILVLLSRVQYRHGYRPVYSTNTDTYDAANAAEAKIQLDLRLYTGRIVSQNTLSGTTLTRLT
jgi:hypothetical protein